MQSSLPDVEEQVAQFERDKELLRAELSRLEQRQALIQQQKDDAERQQLQLANRRDRLNQ